MYNDLTGMQNLKFYADLYGDISKERIDEVIELVGLKVESMIRLGNILWE